MSDLSNAALTAASKKIDLALVADTEFNAASGGDAQGRMLAEINIVDGIFSEQVGVQLNVVESRVLTDNGPLTSSNAETLVFAFRLYVANEIGNPGVTHLFTGKNLNGSVIGIAFVSGLCSSFGVGVTQSLGSVTALIAAHEIGHNFGAPHDNESGSACAGTPGNFLMNPSINGSNQFSQCSLNQMASRVDAASCIVDNTAAAPVITSTPNLVAQVDLPYQYDENSTVEASGTSPITFELDIGPDGMSLTDDGELNWVPIIGQEGTHPVQITAFNSFGSDTQNFEIQVSSAFVDFNNANILSYGGNQDVSGTFSVEDGGASLRITGNSWKKVALPYVITPNTVIELDFSTSNQGEIHGIGLDTDDGINEFRTFNLFGSQIWGNRNIRYSGSGNPERLLIPVGQFYTGTVQQLFFVNDHDVANPTASSLFSNVQVYEQGQFNGLNLDNYTVSEYAVNQDTQGFVEVVQSGLAIRLGGNKWQKITIPVTLTADSVLEFEFQSTAEGEIHGIGFDNNNSQSEARTFSVYGTQNWGVRDFRYTTPGEYQRFEIPVGQYYTGNNNVLFFIMDHDVANPTGVSTFRNIIIR